jgi:hypothetical protein
MHFDVVQLAYITEDKHNYLTPQVNKITPTQMHGQAEVEEVVHIWSNRYVLEVSLLSFCVLSSSFLTFRDMGVKLKIGDTTQKLN